MDPSIGNWSFPCGSHYWLKNNKVQWSHQWSKAQIESGQEFDMLKKQQYLEVKNSEVIEEIAHKRDLEKEKASSKSFWQKLLDKIF